VVVGAGQLAGDGGNIIEQANCVTGWPHATMVV
jgi:hypothetical protein